MTAGAAALPPAGVTVTVADFVEAETYRGVRAFADALREGNAIVN
jgi:hypothetical protein